MYIALLSPDEFINGYLEVPFVGSVAGLIAEPVAVEVHHLENFPPGKIPVLIGMVMVAPALAKFPKINLFVPKFILAPVVLIPFINLTLLNDHTIFGIAELVFAHVK
jgi:hypothetical protein